MAHTIVNFAIEKKELNIRSPFSLTRRDFKSYRLVIDNVRDRYMTKDELNLFLKECKEISKKPKHKNIYLMALLGLSIAARQQTIMTIRISDIDFENDTIKLRNHKTEKRIYRKYRQRRDKERAFKNHWQQRQKRVFVCQLY